MENFVLNLFSDQLSKIILDFHQSSINANFLSGKGSITNIKLNVGLINDFLNKPPHGTVPFLEFTEITLSELRVEVTSYTNLKRAPIVLVIEEIHAAAREPLEYHVDSANAQVKKKAASGNDSTNSPPKKASSVPQPYGLLHRILDNLSIKIRRINLTFSSLGKFKTRRGGIWSPPTLQVSLDNVAWICVTEAGNPGTPEQVWAHNELGTQQSRFRRDASAGDQHRHRSYVIYRRLSMMCSVKLLSSSSSSSSSSSGDRQKEKASPKSSVSTLISDTKIDVHVAYVRRLRDAGVTGADLDVQVHEVEINLDVASYDKTSPSKPTGCDVGAFVHMLVGLLHCYYKDRSFVDPLLPEGVVRTSGGDGGGGMLLRGFGGLNEKEELGKDETEEPAGPDDFLPEVALMDDDLDSSDESDYERDSDEEMHGAFLKEQDSKEDGAEGDQSAGAEGGGKDKPTTAVGENVEDLPQSGDRGEVGAKTSMGDGAENDIAPAKSYERKRKAVIVIASGAQKFEKLSFSLSIPRINMKLCLPKEPAKEPPPAGTYAGDPEAYSHCLELLLEGLVAECIWPKNEMGEMGGHVQGSIKYLHLFESAYRKEWGANRGAFGPMPWNVVKISPLLRVGKRIFQGHDSFSLSPKLEGYQDSVNPSTKCDEFPTMESRRTTRKWDHRLKEPRALAFKSTISFVDETLTRWSRTNVKHEASLGELEVVLDSAPIQRLTKLFSNPGNLQNRWFDERWLSGDWRDEITLNTIADDAGDCCLKDYLQPLPSLYPSRGKRSAMSSELRSVTAHLDSITVRLPNPMMDLSSFWMADVIFSISEATLLVSSDLPSSFLSGVVAAENTSHDFPHDPSDISCSSVTPASGQSADQGTQFRMQLSLTDCSLKIMTVDASSLHQNERCFGDLLAPTNVTMLMSLEHKDAQESTNEKRSLMLSLLIHSFGLNVELRSIHSALDTLSFHVANIIKEKHSEDSVDESIPKSTTTGENFEPCERYKIICIHAPEIAINIWGDQAHDDVTSESQLKYTLLSQIKASQFEFGMEYTNLMLPLETKSRGSIYKCGIATVSVEICSADHKMVEILSMGAGRSHLAESAFAFCFPNVDVGSVSGRGFLLRSEKQSVGMVSTISASAVEIASPLAVDIDINAIEFFLNILVGCCTAPVFVGSRSDSSNLGQTPLGSAMWKIVLKLASQLSSPKPKHIKKEESDEGVNSLFRMSLCELLLLVPSISESGECETFFGLIFSDTEIAVGEINSLDTHHVIEKHCAHGGRTWGNVFRLLDEEPAKSDNNAFHAFRSSHSLISIGPMQEFKVILPVSSVNYSSDAPPFDVSAMKAFSLSLMNMGMPMSSLYFKLYKLTSKNESDQSDFSLAATRLHNSIGGYHCQMNSIISRMNAEIDRLRETVFSKENERVGALALAASTAAGWVRVGEELSFSHRIFSSATFWRYWMVLDKSLLILFKAPGTRPSFIIPLRSSSQLRSLSMSSSSGKAPGSIVSNHIRQTGFAVLDSTEGTGLFFVAADNTDHSMWVQGISQAISMVSKKEESNLPDSVSSSNANFDGIASQSDGALLSTAGQAAPSSYSLNSSMGNDSVPKAPSADDVQNEDTFAVFDDVSTPMPPQAHTLDPSTVDVNTLPVDRPPGAAPGAGSGDPIGVSEGEISPSLGVSSDYSELEDVDMEDISLDNDNDNRKDSSDQHRQASPADFPSQTPISVAPHPQTKEPSQEQTLSSSSQPPLSVQSLPMRQRLALAKGKSKFASAKFGSAIKTAKDGMISSLASEVGRDDTKQRVAKEAPRREEPMKRSLGKMSMLKRNANTKLVAARLSMQDQVSGRLDEPANSTCIPTSLSNSSRDELSGNRKVAVGQKMSLLKKNVTTAVLSSVQDQPTVKVNAEDSLASSVVPGGSSQEVLPGNRSSKQELRKKFANMDQSMTNTMRRLKIDEKVTQLSAAVKSGVKNDPVMRQLSHVGRAHSKSSDHSKQRLGIGEESKSLKPIKFDAFSASSDLPLPLKVKSSITHGNALQVDDAITEKIESLRRIGGSWVVDVGAIKLTNVIPLSTQSSSIKTPGEGLPPSTDQLTKPSVESQVSYKWKHVITATDIGSDKDETARVSVDRTMSEVLALHTRISEIMANHLPLTTDVFHQEGFSYSGTLRPVLKKLSSLDQLRVAGKLLQRALEVDVPSANVQSLCDKHCELIKAFISTLLDCHMPEEALLATKGFLEIIDDSLPEISVDNSTYLTNGTHLASEAFELVSNAMAEKEPVSPINSLDVDPMVVRSHSSLMDVIMNGYAKAMKERDEALASLATTSIINENHIMKAQLAKRNEGSKPRGSNANSSDAEMMNLCKQLGNEIASRSAAETAINALNERLEFERKIAEAKESELRAEIARYKNTSSNR